MYSDNDYLEKIKDYLEAKNRATREKMKSQEDSHLIEKKLDQSATYYLQKKSLLEDVVSVEKERSGFDRENLIQKEAISFKHHL